MDVAAIVGEYRPGIDRKGTDRQVRMLYLHSYERCDYRRSDGREECLETWSLKNLRNHLSNNDDYAVEASILNNRATICDKKKILLVTLHLLRHKSDINKIAYAYICALA